MPSQCHSAPGEAESPHAAQPKKRVICREASEGVTKTVLFCLHRPLGLSIGASNGHGNRPTQLGHGMSLNNVNLSAILFKVK
uniref:Uncharacterized protein n=1 Tax=Panagrellus redivivus TaxID=6233 RepID=A0A7E4URQ9_PANRE